MKTQILFALLVCGMAPGISRASDFDSLCADRVAIERVYYQHRLGTKPPFEQVMPRDLAEKLVRQDLHKEAVLKKIYGVEITDALLAAEVRRIDSTTRAPDVLAELKAALGNDTNRFARTVARPIVVERFLRDKFDNDDAIHAPQRRNAEKIRAELLTARQDGAGLDGLLALFRQRGSNQVHDTTWQLGKRPDEPRRGRPDLGEVQRRFGAEAQLVSPPREGDDAGRFYFDDLPAELRQVLRAQLLQPGDVSAVIETPAGFFVYLCTEKTASALSAATLFVPKRSYEQWLKEMK